MKQDDDRSRRRVLRASAVAVAASTAVLAGCGGPGEGEGEPESEEGTGNGQDREDDTDNGQDQNAETGNGQNQTNETEDDDDLAADDSELEAEAEEEGPENVTEAESWDDVQEILLGTGEEQVWVGEEPSLIAGEENPSLELVAGESYDIGYVNNGGEGHTLSILAGEQDRTSTDVDNEEGAEHWLTIEADEDLTGYRCEVHPDAMAGDIEISEE